MSAERVEVTSESDSRHELGRCKTLSKLGLAQGGTVPTARHHVALPHKTAVAADALIWLVKTESHLWKQFAAAVLNDADEQCGCYRRRLVWRWAYVTKWFVEGGDGAKRPCRGV